MFGFANSKENLMQNILDFARLACQMIRDPQPDPRTREWAMWVISYLGAAVKYCGLWFGMDEHGMIRVRTNKPELILKALERAIASRELGMVMGTSSQLADHMRDLWPGEIQIIH